MFRNIPIGMPCWPPASWAWASSPLAELCAVLPPGAPFKLGSNFFPESLAHAQLHADLADQLQAAMAGLRIEDGV